MSRRVLIHPNVGIVDVPVTAGATVTRRHLPLIDWSTHLQVTSLFTPSTPVATLKSDLLCDKDAFNTSSVTALTPH